MLKGKKGILKGWSLDAYGSRKNIGIGVAYDIYNNDMIEIDMGLYGTKEYKEIFDFRSFPDISVGLSGTFKF